MKKTNLVIIAAIAENGVLGCQGKIPWYFPEDLRRFRKLTLKNTVIMGRKTYDSLPLKFKPLPERNNIVITRNEHYNAEGAITASSIEEALEMAKSLGKENYIIGGEQIYRSTVNLADKLEVTEVKGNFIGDAFFPEIDSKIWNEIHRKKRDQYSFVTYVRKVAPI